MAGGKYPRGKATNSGKKKPETQNPMPFTRVKTGGHRANPRGGMKGMK